MPRYKGDPRWMTAKYDSVCYVCKKPIKKYDRIFYYPNGKHVLCSKIDCGEKAAREFASAAFDEGS